jgi:hypothetical protein
MNPFTDHPATVGESYLEHMRVALGFGAAMLVGGLACIVHALLPALFVTTGSQTIEALHDRMVTKRRQKGLRNDAPFDFVI